MRRTWIAALAGLTALGALGYAFGFVPAPVSSQQARAVEQPEFAARVEGRKAFDFGEDIGAFARVCLLPLVTDQAGEPQRPVCVMMVYVRGFAELGDAHYTELVPAGSTAAINMSMKDLDIALGLPDPTPGTHQEVFAAFEASVRPRPGLTWGQVSRFETDVLITAQRTN